MLPPPVSMSAGPPISPRSMLPPPVDAFTLPTATLDLQHCRRPPRCMAPCSPESTITLPPPVSAMIFPFTDRIEMLPPPVCSFRSPPTVPTSIESPPVSAIHRAANVIHAHAAATALNLHAPGDARRFHSAPAGLDLHQLGVARNVDHELSGELASDRPIFSAPAH